MEGNELVDDSIWRYMHLCIPRTGTRPVRNRAIAIRTGHYFDSPCGVDIYKWNGLESNVRFQWRPSFLPHKIQAVSTASLLSGVLDGTGPSMKILPTFPQVIRCWQQGPLDPNNHDPVMERFFASSPLCDKIVYHAAASWGDFQVSLVRGFRTTIHSGDFGPGLYLYENFNEVRRIVENGGGYISIHDWSNAADRMRFKSLERDEWTKEVNLWQRFWRPDRECVSPTMYEADFICGATVPKTHWSEEIDLSDSEDEREQAPRPDNFLDYTTYQSNKENTADHSILRSNDAKGAFDSSAQASTHGDMSTATLFPISVQFCGISENAYRFAAESLLGVVYIGPGKIKHRET